MPKLPERVLSEEEKKYIEEQVERHAKVHKLQHLDAGQLDLMFNFLKLGELKPDAKDVENLIEYVDKVRQALVQNSGGQRSNDPKEYVHFGDLGTYINLIVIECLSLRISGVLDRLLELMKQEGGLVKLSEERIHIKDFVVGQTAYVSGWEREKEPTEVKVKRVGRKYVTVGRYSWEEHKFQERSYCKNTLIEVTKYGAPSSLYKSKEDYDRACEIAKLGRWIDSELPEVKHKLSLEQMRSIKNMVDGFVSDIQHEE